jgi:hypothetical protein
MSWERSEFSLIFAMNMTSLFRSLGKYLQCTIARVLKPIDVFNVIYPIKLLFDCFNLLLSTILTSKELAFFPFLPRILNKSGK